MGEGARPDAGTHDVLSRHLAAEFCLASLVMPGPGYLMPIFTTLWGGIHRT